MHTEDEFEDKLEEVQDWLERADETVIDDYHQELDDGEDLKGHRFKHGSQDAVIVGARDREFFTVAFGYNVISQLAEQMAVSDALEGVVDNPANDEPIEVDADVTEGHLNRAENAVRNRLKSAGLDTKTKMHFKCLQFLSHPDVAFQLHTDDEKGVYGFEVTRKEWVFSGGYGPEKLSRGIQSVISVGLPARVFLQRSYGLDQQFIEIGTGPEITLGEESSEGRAYY